jgi:mannose-6-phosphate isomerase class I
MGFEPIYQYRLWGGRHLADLLTAPLPSGPIGEAWVLSDRDDHPSHVADGPLKGRTIGQLLEQFPEELLGGWLSVSANLQLGQAFLIDVCHAECGRARAV